MILAAWSNMILKMTKCIFDASARTFWYVNKYTLIFM